MLRISIDINDLKIFAHHGVSQQERKCGNLYSVSLSLAYPAIAAAMSDDIGGTIDYSEAVSLVTFEMQQSSALLEHVAWRIRAALVKRWPKIEAGRICVTKLSPPIAADLASASVTVVW